MTTGKEPGAERTFAPDVLPWMVAAGAFIFYLATLNHWVSLGVVTFNPWPWPSFGNLSQVAKTAGWTWQPGLFAPAYFVVTYPFRWLPAPWIPLALNLFSAACAAATLGLLARSVAILPQDRTDEQRQREQSEHSFLSIPQAWIPPLLAVLAGGLQLTFWEHATNGTEEMFDLLLFAFVLWSLLEYRTDGRDSRLTRAAFVYGVGMTDNWAMIAFLPAFIAALVWIRGLGFFNLRFLGRMTVCGFAGLLLYLLLPLLGSFSDLLHINFWQALKLNLGSQKNALFSLPFNKYALFHGDKPLWILALPSLLPVLALSIRWPSYFGDSSRLGVVLATAILHLVCAVFLLVCSWVAFDPPFSPRHFVLGIPFLTLYFLGALSVGYYAGYFLLLANARPVRTWRSSSWPEPLSAVVRVLVWLLLVLVPVGLIFKNLPQLRVTNGDLFKQYTSLIEAGLPRAGGILLSDDPRRLFLVQASLARHGRAKDFLPLDTQSLKWPGYHRFLRRNYPQRWSETIDAGEVDPISDVRLINLVTGLFKTNAIYYLQPSFGYYFEYFGLEPHGLVYKLALCPTNSLLPPPLSRELIAENEAFWNRTATDAFTALPPLVSPPTSDASGNPIDRFLKALRLPRDPNLSATAIGTFYSRGLNYWGVQLQGSGNLEGAAAHFQTALQLNPDNVVARINLTFNQALSAGHPASVPLSKSVEDRFGKYRNWNQVIGENGPFDEPGFCCEQGRLFFQTGLYRQSAEAFARARALSPDSLPARIGLAQLYIMANLPDDALELLNEIRSHPETFPLTRTNQSEVVFTEASAYLAKNDPPKANRILETAYANDPGDESLLARVVQVYLAEGSFSNALDVINRRLSAAPDDCTSLMNKGYVCIQLNAYDDAVSTLTRLLKLQNNNYLALLNRAIAYLRSDKLDAARQDYEALEKLYPAAHQVQYGLAEIAYRTKDTNTAVKHYKAYLTSTDTNSPESKFVSQRLKELKSGSP